MEIIDVLEVFCFFVYECFSRYFVFERRKFVKLLWCVSVNRDKTVLQYKTIIALFTSTRLTTSGDRLQPCGDSPDTAFSLVPVTSSSLSIVLGGGDMLGNTVAACAFDVAVGTSSSMLVLPAVRVARRSPLVYSLLPSMLSNS